MQKTFLLAALIAVSALLSGCAQQPSGQSPAAKSAEEHTHKSKYNEVLVEFPGHQYALEIIDEKETTGLVTAFLTDAHFEPVKVDAKEVKLHFIINGSPRTFTLIRQADEDGKPAAFALTDKELAVLNCEGWEGEATANIVIDGTPYSSKLIKQTGHDHTHGGGGHGH